MKRFISIIILSLTLIGTNSCSKKEGAQSLSKVSAPNWAVDTTGKYPLSMTAVVKVPVGIVVDISEADQIGAFCGDECRGLGSLIKTGTASVFFIMIHGTGLEQVPISFRYYSVKNSRMYDTAAFLDFEIDGNYGTIDAPEELDIKLRR
jgi:hypothetical protein